MLKYKIKLFIAIFVASIVLNATGDMKQAEYVYFKIMNRDKKVIHKKSQDV